MADHDAAAKAMFKEEMAEKKAGKDEDDEYALTPQIIEAIKLIFTQFDTNENGSIDKAELANLCRALGDPLTRSELDQAFKDLDTDGSGKIQWEEFIMFWQNS